MVDTAVVIHRQFTMTQGEDVISGRIAQAERNIRVVVGEVGKMVDDLAEQARLQRGVGHLYGQHVQRPGKQIFAQGAGQLYRDGLLLQKRHSARSRGKGPWA